MQVVGRAAPVAAVERVGLFILLCQRRLHKGGGRPQQGRQPHPEDRARAAHRERRHHAHEVAHAHPGGRGHHQRLKRGKPLLVLVFLADGGDHIPEQPHGQKAGAQGEVDARREQQNHHQRKAERRIAQRQGEQIAPQQVVHALNESNDHKVSSPNKPILSQCVYYSVLLQVCKVQASKARWATKKPPSHRRRGIFLYLSYTLYFNHTAPLSNFSTVSSVR